MRGNIFSEAYLISNAGALLVLFISIIFKRTGRVIMALLFLIAAIDNAWLAIHQPSVYSVYERLAALPVYEVLIHQVFLEHITTYMLILMLFQLAISLGLLWRGKWEKIALSAAIIYLLALAPLGAGSSFPCTVILALACMVLLWEKHVSRITIKGLFE